MTVWTGRTTVTGVLASRYGLWVFPSADPARALADRIEKDRLHGERIAALAAGFPIVRVDGTRPVGAIVTDGQNALPDLGWDHDPAGGTRSSPATS